MGWCQHDRPRPLPRRGMGNAHRRRVGDVRGLDLGRVRSRTQLVGRLRQTGRVPTRFPRLRRREGRGDDGSGCRPAAAGPFDHSQPGQDPGDHRQRQGDEILLAEPRRARGLVLDQSDSVHLDRRWMCRRRRPRRTPFRGSRSRRGTASSGRPACTPSCRTSAWSTTTFTGVSGPATTTLPDNESRDRAMLSVAQRSSLLGPESAMTSGT